MDGWIEQRGFRNGTADITVTVTFPIPFSSIEYAFSGPINRNSSSQNSAFRYMYDLTTSNFKYREDTTMSFTWIVKGY